jgi:hypothetical protein
MGRVGQVELFAAALGPWACAGSAKADNTPAKMAEHVAVLAAETSHLDIAINRTFDQK